MRGRRGCPHAVKVEREGKRSAVSLQNDPGVSPVFSKTTMLVLILGKIRHDHKTNIHENPEMYFCLMEAGLKLLKATQMPKYSTAPLGSLVSPFRVIIGKFVLQEVNLIAGLIKFNYAIVCQFETVTLKNLHILHMGKI